MFYPGDPVEERKRQLIQRLSGQRRGGGAGAGQRVGRAPGFFGRGMGFAGSPGQSAFGQSHMPAFAGVGGGGGGFEANPPQFNMGGDVQHIGPSQTFQGASLAGAYQPPQHPVDIRALLGAYGQQSAPQMPQGFGTRYF